MKRKMVAVGLVFTLGMGLLSCGAKEKASDESTIQSEETVETIEESQGETIAQEEKKERLKPSEFTNLPKVAEQVGFHFRAPEALDEERKFRSFMISQEWEKDENGEEVGEPYPVVTIGYPDKVKCTAHLIVKKVEEEPEKPVTYVSSETIGGMEVSFLDYINRIVDEDYVMTEEDWELYNSGKMGFACGGDLGDSHHYKAYWIEDGIMYYIEFGYPNMSYENRVQIIENIMNAEFQ